jgi:DSF synthase
MVSEIARKYGRSDTQRHSMRQCSPFYQIGREVNAVTIEELSRVVQVWADACLQLRDRDLKVMQRLVAAQDRLQAAPLAAE